jgi:CopG family nickel-responsive transcriptional regulator
LVVVSLSIPDELLEALDAVTGGERQATRSEVVRQALNSYLSEYHELKQRKGELIATITILHEKTDRGQDLDLQHEFDDIVAQYHHTHLSGRTCLEIMVVKGSSGRFKELIDGLKANRHVTQLKYFIMSAEPD